MYEGIYEGMYDGIIVGAGAAGLMAAASVADETEYSTHGPEYSTHGPEYSTHGPAYSTHGPAYSTHISNASQATTFPHLSKFLVLEKNTQAGRKLLLSGSGQCNFTHTGPIDAFLSHYGDGGNVGERGRFVRAALTAFTNTDLIVWFERRGVPAVVTPAGKVFPRSMRATDLRNTLLAAAHNGQVPIRYGDAVEQIEQTANGFEVVTRQGQRFQTRTVLLTTGGFTYPATGSQGDGYRFAERLGHHVIPARVALVSIRTRDYASLWAEVAGVSLQGIAVTLTNSRFRRAQTFTGDLLFTHRGLSGPVILEMSRYLNVGDRLVVSLVPQHSAETVATFERTGDGNGILRVRKFLKTVGIPERLTQCVMRRLGMASDQTISQLPRSLRCALCDAVTAAEFVVTGFGGRGEAMVTAGGVDRREVFSKTMESRICPGVFFAGEILDVDGDTGGYNLQFAFSSAKLAVRKMDEMGRERRVPS